MASKRMRRFVGGEPEKRDRNRWTGECWGYETVSRRREIKAGIRKDEESN